LPMMPHSIRELQPMLPWSTCRIGRGISVGPADPLACRAQTHARVATRALPCLLVSHQRLDRERHVDCNYYFRARV